MLAYAANHWLQGCIALPGHIIVKYVQHDDCFVPYRHFKVAEELDEYFFNQFKLILVTCHLSHEQVYLQLIDKLGFFLSRLADSKSFYHLVVLLLLERVLLDKT